MARVTADESGSGAIAVVATATGQNATGVSVTADAVGVFARSTDGEALHGETRSKTVAAVAAFNLNPDSDAATFYAKKEGDKGSAAYFDGRVGISRDLFVDGDITLANVADFAEDFGVEDADRAEPGTVVVLVADDLLRISDKPYDTRVAGVVSGAGRFRPGIVLDRRSDRSGRLPIALLGKVFCKVDADLGRIDVGDMLTTSSTAGHAMRVADRHQALGAVLGKAMAPLAAGRACIPVLACLQ